MRCWACSHRIRLDDLVKELPIIGALVHRGCYERVTGLVATKSKPLARHFVRPLIGATEGRGARDPGRARVEERRFLPLAGRYRPAVMKRATAS
jgi:hypothetical protein